MEDPKKASTSKIGMKITEDSTPKADMKEVKETKGINADGTNVAPSVTTAS
ncbi:hypothetical protein [Wolbachia endosymbiont of Ctenocephalides felis wCfeT]|uniref:hypothetical protein n=1 Tax=Wolbachia endosymbiont of Ctenocephalides felis wCfeT TaxID=2732593 RepID=UPI0014483F94|nr:hypothetical protein [Wolbachia endosymbiont of Ctenocephalides felis wCfeT]